MLWVTDLPQHPRFGAHELRGLGDCNLVARHWGGCQLVIALGLLSESLNKSPKCMRVTKAWNVQLFIKGTASAAAARNNLSFC